MKPLALHITHRPFSRIAKRWVLASAVWAVLQGYAGTVDLAALAKEDTQDIQSANQSSLRSEVDAEELYLVRALLYRNADLLGPQQIEALAPEIVRWSEEYKFDPIEVLAVMRVESFFNPRAHSYAGAYGLMQLLPYVAQAEAKITGDNWLISVHDQGIDEALQVPIQGSAVSLMNPFVNIRLGIHYLHRLRARFPNPDHYLAAYNMGPTLLQSRLKAGIEPHGVYSGKVYEAQRKLQRQAARAIQKRRTIQAHLAPKKTTMHTAQIQGHQIIP